MIRVVLDTNVLVSAGISAFGDCNQIIRAALNGEITVVVSPGIIAEYFDVLQRSKFTKYGFPPVWVQQLVRKAEHLPADPIDKPILNDPDDQIFLSVANCTGILVTGNIKHFPRQNRESIQVFTPREFLERLSDLLS